MVYRLLDHFSKKPVLDATGNNANVAPDFSGFWGAGSGCLCLRKRV